MHGHTARDADAHHRHDASQVYQVLPHSADGSMHQPIHIKMLEYSTHSKDHQHEHPPKLMLHHQMSEHHQLHEVAGHLHHQQQLHAAASTEVEEPGQHGQHGVSMEQQRYEHGRTDAKTIADEGHHILSGVATMTVTAAHQHHGKQEAAAQGSMQQHGDLDLDARAESRMLQDAASSLTLINTYTSTVWNYHLYSSASFEEAVNYCSVELDGTLAAIESAAEYIDLQALLSQVSGYVPCTSFPASCALSTLELCTFHLKSCAACFVMNVFTLHMQ